MIPFENPFEPGHEHHLHFESRTVYHAYRRQTEWLELLGFVLPKANAGGHGYVALSTIAAVKGAFDAGEKLPADSLLVRTD